MFSESRYLCFRKSEVRFPSGIMKVIGRYLSIYTPIVTHIIIIVFIIIITLSCLLYLPMKIT
jgi:hypothetical protein